MTMASDGRRLGGRFVIEREVGRGAAGTVFRAHDLVTDGPVALKVMGEAGMALDEAERLAREGLLLADISHPGIVKTVAHGVLEESSLPFVAMEWLDGEDLARRSRREPLSMNAAVELTILVGEALGAAHDAGIIHRDIKPSNIFLCSGNAARFSLGFTPKLVDFGVATSGDLHMSRAGDVVGTPAYMAPEQARGDAQLDLRCDVYSLGATLFELLAGRPPHMGSTAVATLARLVTTPPPRLVDLRRDVPEVLDRLVSEMLAIDPELRPGSMQHVLTELEAARASAPQSTYLESIQPTTSGRLGSSASRLVTTIVALGFDKASARERALEHLRQRGADAVRLGSEAIVAHLGARLAVGSEAAAALDLGRRLSQAGAKVGIASGRARVTWTSAGAEAAPVGEVVDRASSLARDAQGGMVLADVTTSELGRGRYEFRARDDGSAIVGDQIRGPRGEGAGGAPFVGREPELAQVLSAFERAKDDATPILVSLTGPPGIGKTRLRREVLARISARADAPHIVLQRSDAYGRGHALGAAADVLRAIISLPKGATVSEAASAFDARLGPATRSELSAQNREVLARLLANEPLPEGLDPRGARDVLWLAMTDVVLEVVSHQPTVVVVEDLQWADVESIGWLDHMLGRAGHRPLLVMAMVRPQFWNDHPSRFAGRDHVRIELRPISRRATCTMARALLGERVSDDVIERIAAQAAGLPLFAEELARLTAAGRVAEHAPTIETAIQASLDVLDEECRDAVGRLSVCGLTCWDAALEALGMPRAESILKALTGAELLVEQNSSRFAGVREWSFKHALVRDVAYSSLGERERAELHALVASWLSTMGEDAATVAGHYDLGKQHAAAANHWARAAQRALATNALTDALEMADRALTFAESPESAFLRASYLDDAYSRLDPRAADRESAIRAMEENVYDEASSVRARGARARYEDARGVSGDISERLATTRDEAAVLGLKDEVARCSAALAARSAFAGDFEHAEEEVRRLLELAEGSQIRVAAVDAYQTQAIIRQSQGALSAALQARRNAVAAARSAGLKEREAMLNTNLGFALTTIGARQEARAALETGRELADAIGSSGAVRHAQMNLLGWAATFGSDKRLDGHLAEVRADADAAASGLWVAPDRSNLGILFYRGCELLRLGNETACRRAAVLLRMSAEGYRTTGYHDVLPVALGMWAEAERRCQNKKRALSLASEAADLLVHGAPSLLNESAVFVALHHAELDLGREDRAREALARAMPALQKRLQGLAGTPYARQFLTELPANAALLASAEAHGIVPDEIHRLLERGTH
jgi:predicted ATPase